MFKRIRKWFLKLVYRALIFKSVVIDRDNIPVYSKLETLCAMEVDTEKGPFTFLFKKDRRQKFKHDVFPYVKSYVVELKLPEGVLPSNEAILNKVVIVIKIRLFEPDYQILIELLTEVYLDRILRFIVKEENAIKMSLTS